MKKNLIQNRTVFLFAIILFAIVISTIFVIVTKADNLDEHNSDTPEDYYYLYRFYPLAQSFPPDEQVITRAQLYLSASLEGLEDKLIVLLCHDKPYYDNQYYRRKDIDLTNIRMWPACDWIWVDFEPDLNIISGEDYYLVAVTYRPSSSPYYHGWCYTKQNNYEEGAMWSKDGSTWDELTNWDCNFKQYGQARESDPQINDPDDIHLPDASQGETVSDTFTLNNNAGESGSHLVWEIESYPDWIDLIRPTWGEIAKGEETNVHVQVTADNMPRKTYDGDIKIISNGGTRYVYITLEVAFVSQINVSMYEVLPGESLPMDGQQSGGVDLLNWTWDFDDGNFSYDQNTTHVYQNLGNYSVLLNVTDSNENSTNDTVEIKVKTLIANFSSNSVNLKPNEIFYFNDTSRGCNEITNWSWDFNDGNISYDRNVSKQYTLTGEYNVTLTVLDNQSKTDTYYQLIYVDSLPPTINSISVSPDKIGINSNVTIISNIIDNSNNIDEVKINVTFPDDTYQNSTVDIIENNNYSYLFTETSQIGEYSFIKWAKDKAGNINSSTEIKFIVSHLFGSSNNGTLNHSVKNMISGSMFTRMNLV